MLPLLAVLLAPAALGEELAVDAQFPGGNIVVEKIDGDTVSLCQDQRDTPQFWFYWCFRVTGAAGRSVTFQFTKGNVFGPRGPAGSSDGGQNWHWLGADCVKENSFSHRFTNDAREMRFCFAIPYLDENLRLFLKQHAGDQHLSVEKLAETPRGRSVELLRAGRLDGKAARRVLVTARHHACETMADYVLEGLLAAALADDDDGKWLRENVEITVVPFIDKDGVEDGDQGKLRAPYDHWLDYLGDSRYAVPRELRRRFESEPRLRVDVALDIHCPAMRDEQIFFATGRDPHSAAQAGRLSELLEQHQRGPLKHQAKHNLPFGKGWNTQATYDRHKSFHLWAEELSGNPAAATLEVPYATAHGAEVTAASARLLGRDLALVLRLYLENSTEIQPQGN